MLATEPQKDMATLAREEMAAFERLPAEVQRFILDCPIEVLATVAELTIERLGKSRGLVYLRGQVRAGPALIVPAAGEVLY